MSEMVTIERRAAVEHLLKNRDDMLVVCGLGSSTYDVYAAGDNHANFYLWGAMGGAIMIGLGLAIAEPDRQVMVITGDGEALMGMGSLATAAMQAPANLSVVVIDNERYGETGMQITHTAGTTDLAAVAAACGIPVTGVVLNQAELDAALPVILEATGPVLHVVKVRAKKLDFVLPPKDGVHLKNRFRRALLGAEAVI